MHRCIASHMMKPFVTVQAASLSCRPGDDGAWISRVWAEAAWQSPIRSVAYAPGGGRGLFNVLP